MKTLISIDESTTNTGVAVFNLETEALILYQLITPKNIYESKKSMSKQKKAEIRKANIAHRVDITIKALLDILNEYQPDIVIVEDTYGGKDLTSYKHLCRLQGAIFGFCINKGTAYFTKFPAAWRKILGFTQNIGKKKVPRKELKRQAIEYVKTMFGINVSDDEADSICIGLSYFKEKNNGKYKE